MSFTLQTDAHVLPELQKQVAVKMDEILAPKPVATTVATKPKPESICLKCQYFAFNTGG